MARYSKRRKRVAEGQGIYYGDDNKCHAGADYLQVDAVYCGHSEELMQQLQPGTISLSFWSPPYFLGKSYERNNTYDSWQGLLKTVTQLHSLALKPGGFLVINIADIMAFRDPSMPRFQAMNLSGQKSPITKDMVPKAKAKHPDYNRYQLADLLGCSEQTIDRRLHGVNIRGGKYQAQTRVKLVGGGIESFAYDAGLYLYDRRIWKKDPTWANSKWTTNSLKSVSEIEDLYIFWKPGEITIDRKRLSPEEWKGWGYRQVWEIPSVRRNDDHEAKFPEELARRVIKLYSDPGDTVLDPFLGSGTTAVAAVKLRRHYIGIEKESAYFELAKKNIRHAEAQISLFLD